MKLNLLKMEAFVIIFLLCFISTFVSGIAMAHDSLSNDLVLIKRGTFIMGSPETEAWREKDERERKITLSDFYLAKYQVSQKEYRELMGHNPSRFKGDDRPVENVTWLEAIKYCNARSLREGLTPAYVINGDNVAWNREASGYRLPTEAEWEYACRAGTSSPFNTDKSITTDEANYYGHYPYMIETYYFFQSQLETKPGVYRGETIPTGSFAPNKWGLFDMHGNVWDWCWDWYASYEGDRLTNPTGPSSGSFRVNRGGGWNDFAKHLRSAYRASTPPSNSSFNLGFRLARNAN
ncbi:MAG: formylglycine-generating enzyme family protein [Deltaproteobacteria bacterium]|jgi:formylglycine-generating enzyme required for sulfatase activity|nr:formylglycine-generating enzyme family protein [Deltaproteobacteria bacterium]